MTEYCRNLFTSTQVNMEEVLDCISPKVDSQQNDFLTKPIEKEEAKQAIFGMHPDK